MATELKVPHLGMDMHEARIVNWRVDEGAEVSKGDPVLEIETDKAIFEVEAPVAGILAGRHYDEGAMAEVGSVLAHLLEPGEELPAVEAPEKTGDRPAAAGDSVEAASPPDRTAVQSATPSTLTSPSAPGRIAASPAARRIAHEQGLALGDVTGSGPGGRVYADDVAGRPHRPAQAPAAAGDAIEDRTVSTRHGALHARVWHAAVPGAPTVVLVHGLFADTTAWVGTATSLVERGFEVVAVDLPCHGESSADAVAFGDVVEATAEAVATMTDGRPIALVAHSYGAAVAARVARKPDLAVKTLVLLAPLGMGHRVDQDFIDGMVAVRSAGDAEAQLSRLTVAGSAPSGRYLDELAASLRARSDRLGALTASVSSGGLLRISILDDLEALNITDIRVVVGTADAIIPWGDALNAPPRVGVHVLRDVGHMPQWEAASVVNDIVQRAARGG